MNDNLFAPNELTDIARLMYSSGRAVSAICTERQRVYLYNNFGRQHVFSVPEQEYDEVMSLFLLMVEQFHKTDGEIIVQNSLHNPS